MSTRGNESVSNSDPCNATGLRLNEPISCRNDYAPKVRKPYTITKQREKWTDEEHKKFVEALKLYGRSWRRIEEHVETKTAVQIRSHAQKFFSKVGRDSNAKSELPLQIPPPRPKRKPMHPYPRKLVIPPVKESSFLGLTRSKSVSGKENQSPTSVLSAVGSDTLGSTASNSPSSLRHNLFSAEESTDEASTRRLQLFGKTFIVTDCHISSSQAMLTCTSLCDMIELKPIQPVAWKFVPGEVSSKNLDCSWPNTRHVPNVFQAKETKHQREKSSRSSYSGSMNNTGDVEKNLDAETQSSRCSSNNEEMELTQVSKFRRSERSAFSQLRPSFEKNKLKGFVPYKKRRILEVEAKPSWTSVHKGPEPEISLCL